METEREMSRYEVSPIGIFLETWDGSGGINRKCLIPRDCFVEAYEKWIKNTTTEKNEKKGHWIKGKYHYDDIRYNDNSYKCDKCGRIVDFKENYCPDCGADMREVDESEEE